ncbi:MAG: response regulator transcription factor [Acetobacteraceae bacterium]|nr:response regulator transcription factor [Acetobacteraceae bacterium]
MKEAPLRVSVVATDTVRRRGLVSMLEAAGHTVTTDAPDVALWDLAAGDPLPVETDTPIVVLTDNAAPAQVTGAIPRAVEPAQLNLALRAAAAGLVVRSPGMTATAGFRAAEDLPALTPREVEILALVGQGMTNKAIARRLGISVHTVKFHLETLFTKLEAASRAEAVAKGLRGGVLEI